MLTGSYGVTSGSLSCCLPALVATGVTGDRSGGTSLAISTFLALCCRIKNVQDDIATASTIVITMSTPAAPILFSQVFVLLGVPKRVAHTRGAFRHMNSRTFEDFRITHSPVEGEVAKGFRIGAPLTVRVRPV